MNYSSDDEYAETIEFPVHCSAGAPMPLLLASDFNKFLIFYTDIRNADDRAIDPLAIVEFHRCMSVKFGDPNDEVLHGHSLYGKGLQPYSVQVLHNSRWLKELEAINSVHRQYDPDFWRSLNHYVFWFHDSTFECVAKSYEVQVVAEQRDEVVTRIAKRLVH